MAKNKRSISWDIVLSLFMLNVLIISAFSFIFEWNTTTTFLYGYVPLLIVIASKVKTNKYLPYYLLAALFLVIFQFALTKKLATNYVMFWLIIPFCLMSSLNKCRDGRFNILLIAGISIYLINCSVVIFEYINGVNLFYFQMDYFDRFRATGIYGHPLYGALLHSSCMLFILCSNLHKIFKIILYIIGFFTVFCYDARTATVVTLASTFFLLYKWKYIRLKQLVPITIILILIPFIIEYLETSGLGGKLFTEEGTKVGKNDARLVAFRIFFDRSFDEIFFGVIDQVKIAERYGVKCIENGVFALILEFGLIPALLTLMILTKNLYALMRVRLPKLESRLFLGSFLVIAVTSQALATAYIWIDYIMLLFLFCNNPQKNEYYILSQKKH